jgi:hypothetical protein
MDNSASYLCTDHVMRRDKSATRRVRKSITSDGNLVRYLHASGFFARIKARSSSVVCPTGRPPVSLPMSLTPSKYRQWRDAGESVRGLMFHAAMSRLYHVRGFTLRLSDKIEEEARSRGKHCLAHLHKRIELYLRRVLKPFGAKCRYWWIKIEEAPKDGALHIHGGIQVDPQFEPMIRKALKGVGGKWAGHGRGNAQLRFSTNPPDFGWAGYCLKECHKVGPGRRRLMTRFDAEKDRRWVAQFHGKSVSASSALRKAAEAEYRRITNSISSINCYDWRSQADEGSYALPAYLRRRTKVDSTRGT